MNPNSLVYFHFYQSIFINLYLMTHVNTNISVILSFSLSLFLACLFFLMSDHLLVPHHWLQSTFFSALTFDDSESSRYIKKTVRNEVLTVYIRKHNYPQTHMHSGSSGAKNRNMYTSPSACYRTSLNETLCFVLSCFVLCII